MGGLALILGRVIFSLSLRTSLGRLLSRISWYSS